MLSKPAVSIFGLLFAISLSGTLSRKKEARMNLLTEGGFSIHGFKVNESDNNYNYLVACEETGECVVIDLSLIHISEPTRPY